MENGEYKILALIGARSGSKGVPGKNIKELAGKPLLGHIVEKASASKYINRVIVSTDSDEYAEVARSHGAETPFLRPEELSADKSPEFEYIKHALKWLKDNEGYEPDIVVRAMATVPLQSTEDLDASIEKLLADEEAHSCVVISEARQHPMKALKLIKDANGKDRLVTYHTDSGREVTPLARQSYEPGYFRANVITCWKKTIDETDSLTGDAVSYHIIPQERAIDIDSIMDFYVAEKIIEHLNEENEN